MTLTGNTILMGGAGGLTERFLKEGNKVIICGRREDTLQSITFPSVITKVCDLSVEAERSTL
jgi:uncharacterized oxidoreductase